MNRRPRVELLAPDLDPAIRFVPGYDLEHSKGLSPERVAAIAITLWELSGTDRSSASISPWRISQLTDNWEGS